MPLNFIERRRQRRRQQKQLEPKNLLSVVIILAFTPGKFAVCRLLWLPLAASLLVVVMDTAFPFSHLTRTGTATVFRYTTHGKRPMEKPPIKPPPTDAAPVFLVLLFSCCFSNILTSAQFTFRPSNLKADVFVQLQFRLMLPLFLLLSLRVLVLFLVLPSAVPVYSTSWWGFLLGSSALALALALVAGSSALGFQSASSVRVVFFALVKILKTTQKNYIGRRNCYRFGIYFVYLPSV